MKNAKNAKIKIVTKESLISLLETKDKSLVLGRALIALFARQTKDEQKDNATEEYNGIGFTGADGRKSEREATDRFIVSFVSCQEGRCKGKDGYIYIAKI